MSRSGSAEHPAAFGYSSDVALYLLVNDRQYELSQIGPSFVSFRTPAEIPPGRGTVVMIVDGKEKRWPVLLYQGAVPFDRDAAIVDL